MHASPVILVLAAGASSRMGGVDKLLIEAGGEPLLRRVVRRACDTGLSVVVAVAPGRPGRAETIRGLPATLVEVPRAGGGMAESLKAAAAAAPETAPVMIVLADMPDIETSDMLALKKAFEAEGGDRLVQAATSDGTPGQPVLFPARLRARLAALTGDRGGREILKDEDPLLVPLSGDRARIDLDTPEAIEEWRKRGN